uniref:Uncharacterized protein n=1 Tax=Triticum urartu TaxID=4572 RepID=A0A8R7K021_TRIUA
MGETRAHVVLLERELWALGVN